MSCVTSLDCPGSETCVDDVCVVDWSYMYYSYVVSSILSGLIAYYFPIHGNAGKYNKVLSVLLAVFVFPVYLVILGYQHPLETNNSPNLCLTILVLLCFWPLYFCMVSRDPWNNYPVATIV